MLVDKLTETESCKKTEIVKIICFGDSITNGGWPGVLQSKLSSWGKYRCGVINKGVNGNTTANAFDRLESDVIPNLPGILMVEFGVNDSNYRHWAKVPRVSVTEYEKNLREFHRIAMQHKSCCIFIVNHLLLPFEGKFFHQGNGKSYQENIEPYNDKVRKVASELNVPTIDLPELLRVKNIDLEKFLDIDGVHLTVFGNQIYAEIVFEELIRILDDMQDKQNF
jgi:lysophospholipase L1-like esterase